ncbi:hypothetical protein AQUCO_01500215v1 [Aquilegia coerulea]|uniref:Uncharacterized protein n=1 Tax=Aquilegia coerulea TaxID=218851 RepID=A0A2G5DSV0_AQUCA|nr:hypothetical protein AQUCO_01500215v1 [Aquilegia coerulea]
MDSQQQEKFKTLGFFCIFKEAFKTVFSAKKIFTPITLAMIFPLSLSMFSHLHILQFLFNRIHYNYMNLYYTASGSSEHKGLVHRLVVLWTIFSLANAAYLVLVFILYLLCNSSVVYTLVSIYAGNKALTFRELLSVLLKVSKKFMIRRVWLMLSYQIATLMFLNCMCLLNLIERPRWVSGPMVALLLTAVNVILFGSINLDWHMACVLSIFEDSTYSTDLRKDKFCTLNKGKSRFVDTIVVVIHLAAVITLGSFNLLVVRENSFRIITLSKVSYWIIFILLLSITFLLGFVIQTISALHHFVCKACHGKTIIDEPSLLLVRLQIEFRSEKDATVFDSIPATIN